MAKTATENEGGISKFLFLLLGFKVLVILKDPIMIF